MDSLVLVVGLIAIIVLVRYDLLLFAVIIGLILVFAQFVKFVGRAGSSLKGPASAIKEDLVLERKEIEKAHGNYPSATTIMGIYNNFIEFLLGDRSKTEEKAHGETHGAGHGGAAHGGEHEHGGAHVEGVHSDKHSHPAAEGSHEEHASG